MLSRDEQKRLAVYLLDGTDFCKFGVLLMLFTGLRIGELCALRWSDVNIKEKVISVSATMQRLLSPDLRAAEKDLKKLVADYHFLQERGIHTTADLQANIEQSKAELSALERERSDISNRIRRPKSPEKQAQNKERRKAVSKQMKTVRGVCTVRSGF